MADVREVFYYMHNNDPSHDDNGYVFVVGQGDEYEFVPMEDYPGCVFMPMGHPDDWDCIIINGHHIPVQVVRVGERPVAVERTVYHTRPEREE